MRQALEWCVIPFGFEPKTFPTEVGMLYPTEIAPNAQIFNKQKRLTQFTEVSL
jgi:hypothetical protein